MDQLKKILVHQFWILLAVALILPLVAWFMAHSSMVATAAARRDKIEAAYKNLPPANNPNESWTREVEQINERQRVSNAAALEMMVSAQLQPSVRWWPANVSGNWDKLSNAEEYTQLQTYRNNYVNEFKRVFNLVHPITDNSMTGMPQTGKVEIQESAISPLHVFSSASPTLKQVMATQEDLWLLEALLKAIDRLNEGAKTQNEALVRRIDELTLRGGGGAKGGAAAGGQSGGAVGANPMMPNGAAATAAAGMPMDGMPVAGSGPFGGGGGSGSSLGSADFNADEVIGAEVEDTSEASSTPASGPSPAGAIGAMANPAAAGFGGANASSTKKGRYVEENDKWKQRAFKLRVVMLHHRLPDLLVELTNIPNFPVKILRVNQVDRTTEELKDLPNAIPTGGPAGGPPGYTAAPIGVAPGGATGFGGRSAFGGNGPVGAPAGGVGEFSQGAAAQSAAMTDPQLADVAILGVITLFKEPPATEVAGGAPAAAAGAVPATVPTTPPGVPSAAPAAPSVVPSAVPGPADVAPNPETAPGSAPAAESPPPPEGTPPSPATPPSGAPPATPQEPPKVP